MSFIKLSESLFEHTTVTLKPKVNFISSSIGGGVTGSTFVSPVRSKCLKDLFDPNKISHNARGLEVLTQMIITLS